MALAFFVPPSDSSSASSSSALSPLVFASVQRPEPHRGEAGVFFKAGGVSIRENHRECFLGDGGPDLFQIFLERDCLAAGFLHAGIAGEDFQGRAETGEDGVRADDAFLGQAWHPFVDAAGQLLQHVAPIADFVRAHRAVGILARAADEMDGGSERALAPARAMRASISVSIGHEPVIIQPASTTAFKMASQLAVVLLAKTMMPMPSGRSTRRPSANAFVNSRLVKCNVLCRCAQLVWSINDDFVVLWSSVALEEVWVNVPRASVVSQT